MGAVLISLITPQTALTFQEARSGNSEDAVFPRPLVFGVSSSSYLSLLSGSGGHSAQMTSYSDSGYQDSSVSYYSNQNVVRSEPRASLSRSPRAEGQASGQVGLISTGLRHPFIIMDLLLWTYALAQV